MFRQLNKREKERCGNQFWPWTLASTATLGACAQNPRVAQDAAIGGLGGAAVGAVVPGVSVIEGAAVGAAIGGLAGAVWSDTNNDGYVDGYTYNGQYYSGTPQGYDPSTHSVLAGAATGALGGAALGAVAGAVIPGVSILQGAVIGAAVGGLAGAVWADRDNDGRVDGYVYNGQYYDGAPAALLRLRLRCRRRLRCGAANAANPVPSRRVLDGNPIGESVNSLRLRVHRPKAGALFSEDPLGRRRAAARGGVARRSRAARRAGAAQPPRPRARASPISTARATAIRCGWRPLRAMPRSNCSPCCRRANLDGLYPDKYHVAALQQALAARAAGKRKQVDATPTSSCRTRSSLMSAT